MSETRWVLDAFAAMGLVMVVVPVALLVRASNATVASETGLDGAVSQAFLAAAKASPALRQPVPRVAQVLTAGMSEPAAREILAASDFVCRTAPSRLDCRREHGVLSCKDDWIVALSLDEHDAVTSTSARRKATCL